MVVEVNSSGCSLYSSLFIISITSSKVVEAKSIPTTIAKFHSLSNSNFSTSIIESLLQDKIDVFLFMASIP